MYHRIYGTLESTSSIDNIYLSILSIIQYYLQHQTVSSVSMKIEIEVLGFY